VRVAESFLLTDKKWRTIYFAIFVVRVAESFLLTDKKWRTIYHNIYKGYFP